MLSNIVHECEEFKVKLVRPPGGKARASTLNSCDSFFVNTSCLSPNAMSLLAFCRAGPSKCRRIYSNDLLKGRNYATEVISAFTKPSAFGQPLYPSHPHLRMFFCLCIARCSHTKCTHSSKRGSNTGNCAQ